MDNHFLPLPSVLIFSFAPSLLIDHSHYIAFKIIIATSKDKEVIPIMIFNVPPQPTVLYFMKELAFTLSILIQEQCFSISIRFYEEMPIF
jgi:hypothetical protein